MSITDKPLPMNELGVAMIQDLGNVYQNQSSHEKNDLLTVWESMYEKGLRRKVSSQCFYTPQEIEEARRKEMVEKEAQEKREVQAEKAVREAPASGQTDETPSNQESKTKEQPQDEETEMKRDFASVHLDRALNSCRAHWYNEGRRYRKRTFSGSSLGEAHDH